MGRRGGVLLTIQGSGLPAWWGRSAGPDFSAMRNRGKNRLGRSPLRTSLWVRGWTCVKPKFGPSPLQWPLFVPPHQATLGSWPYGWAVSTSGPTLAQRRSRRRKPGPRQQECSNFSRFCLRFLPSWSTRPPAAGKRPHTARLEALAMEGKAVSGAGTLQRCDTPSM